MPVTIKSTGGGSVTMAAANTASDYTLTLPASTGTAVVADGSGNVAVSGNLSVTGTSSFTGSIGNITTGTINSGNITTGTINSGNITSTGTVAGAAGTLYPLLAATSQASTSGTSIDFTSIPSWVRRVTVMLNGVSTNGTSSLMVQAGSGSVQSSGYTNFGGLISSGGNALTTGSTSGFQLYLQSLDAAANARYGHVNLTLIGSNAWVMSGVIGVGATVGAGIYGGSVSLSGALDRVRITTVNGTDTFDAGSINILYE